MDLGELLKLLALAARILQFALNVYHDFIMPAFRAGSDLCIHWLWSASWGSLAWLLTLLTTSCYWFYLVRRSLGRMYFPRSVVVSIFGFSLSVGALFSVLAHLWQDGFLWF